VKKEEVKTLGKANFERVMYIILYLIIERFISLILFVIAITQLIYAWASGEPNDRLLGFNQSLAEYMKQLVEYLGFNTDKKPWPMGDWPFT